MVEHVHPDVFAEGVTRAWGDKGLSQWLAGLETLLTVLFFTGVLGYVRAVRQNARRHKRR